jgi:hypothetical protein
MAEKRQVKRPEAIAIELRQKRAAGADSRFTTGTADSRCRHPNFDCGAFIFAATRSVGYQKFAS